jgi:ABC-2 type transport system ATP-binding protein
MASFVLETDKLTKRFGDLVAVRELSLQVHQGELLGFLGPNGAGKTTAISMMCGLLRPDSGAVLVHGKPLTDGAVALRSRLGVCPQRLVIWEKLSCVEQLVFMAEMYGVRRDDGRRRALDLLEALGLREKATALARTLSGGMQRRLNLALALVHDPDVVILDEPEAGLDPQSRILVREYIQGLARRKTVILTTHNMDEAERLAQRVAIMDHGRLLVVDTPEGLKRVAGTGDVLEVSVAESSRVLLPAAMERLKEVVPGATSKEGVVTVVEPGVMNRVAEAVSRLGGAGVVVEDVRVRKRTLEDVFISLTGRGLRE